jgi:hypothetical protein
MAERAFKCPQCNGPLAPSRFARAVTCSYCGATVQVDEAAVSTAAFREAHRQWNAPETHGFGAWSTIGDSHWTLGMLIARGEISDVYAAQRARWPTERALVKVLREGRDLGLFDHEWAVLGRLLASKAPGAGTFGSRLPQPIAHGPITAGAHVGSRATVLRWAGGFVHTFEAVQHAHPHGIEPRAAIWIWRRVLELLSFLHASGYVHGALLPQHLLVQDGEHGVRLVGYSCADHPGAKLRSVCTRSSSFYPEDLKASRTLSAGSDLAMSARCVAFLLGGDALGHGLPAAVPAPLAELVRELATAKTPAPLDAWSLRERLGDLAQALFGAPAFCPIVMPS